MSRLKKNGVIQVGKGVYEIEPLGEELFETVQDQPAETPVADTQNDISSGNTEASAVLNEEQDDYIADEYLSIAEGVNDEDPAEEKAKFTPVTNPLKVAIDNGLIELSDLDEEEEAQLRNSTYKKKKRSPEKRNENTDPSKQIFGFNKGDSPFLLISTIVNFALYAIWLVLYIICVVCRESMLDQAVSQMAMSGTTSYTVEISSPLFTVLRIMLYALPVVMLVWTVAIGLVSKKKKELCDSVFIIAAYAADFVAGTVAVIDIFAIRILFA